MQSVWVVDDFSVRILVRISIQDIGKNSFFTSSLFTSFLLCVPKYSNTRSTGVLNTVVLGSTKCSSD